MGSDIVLCAQSFAHLVSKQSVLLCQVEITSEVDVPTATLSFPATRLGSGWRMGSPPCSTTSEDTALCESAVAHPIQNPQDRRHLRSEAIRNLSSPFLQSIPIERHFIVSGSSIAQHWKSRSCWDNTPNMSVETLRTDHAREFLRRSKSVFSVLLLET